MSNKILVIVESPGKIKNRGVFGQGLYCKSIIWSFFDLDPKELSIDVKNNFEPNYVVNSDKRNVVADLEVWLNNVMML